MNDSLILGFGSEILSDEGIIQRIIHQLKQYFPNTDYKLFSTLSLDVLEEIAGYKKIVILDTIKTIDSVPGRVDMFTINNYSPTLHLENLHDISLPVLIKVGKQTGYTITDEISIITIEILDYLTISTRLSPAISDLYHSIFNRVRDLLCKEIKQIRTTVPA